MKKKGLIISTVVMVVVLIAALTTATFAWFSTSATAKIQDMNFEVAAASSVKIGVRQSTGDATNGTGYRHGENLSYATNAWTGGTENLGSDIQFAQALNLNISAAVGSSADGDTMDETYIYGESSNLYTASGNDYESLGALEAARVNNTTTELGTDVIDLQMGISAAKSDITQTFCKITIEIDTANQSFVGMIAALRFEIQVGSDTSKTYGHKGENTAGDIFGDIHYYDTVAGNAKAIQVESGSKYQFVFYFMIDESGATATKVTPFRIRAFISGYDSDCDIAATGSTATIKIAFDGLKEGESVESNATDYDAKWQKLTLTNEAGD